MRHSAALRRVTTLSVLLVSGGITFLVADVAFPVATEWGTFLHASGPLLVGLSVAAVLGLDAVVARAARRRAWSRPNAWLGPVAVVAVAMPLLALQVGIVSGQSQALAGRVAGVAAEVRSTLDAAGLSDPTPAPPAQHALVISDHPIWLATALGQPVIALPDEPPEDLGRLAADFGSRYVVVFDERGPYPRVLLNAPATACFPGRGTRLQGEGDPAWLFSVASACHP
jgi:hypothetical protein